MNQLTLCSTTYYGIQFCYATYFCFLAVAVTEKNIPFSRDRKRKSKDFVVFATKLFLFSFIKKAFSTHLTIEHNPFADVGSDVGHAAGEIRRRLDTRFVGEEFRD